MPNEKIKQLEELVSSVLQSLDNFYSENSRLEQRIQVLEKEKAASSKENDRAKDLLEKMKKLESKFRKLEIRKLYERSILQRMIARPATILSGQV